MSPSSRWCSSALLVSSLFLGILTSCGNMASEPTPPPLLTPSVQGAPTSPTPCLAIPVELWNEEREFFTALQSEYPSCLAGPVEGSAQALTRVRSGRSKLAVVSGRSPGQGAELVRTEPYALVVNVTSALDDVPLAWLQEVFGRGRDHRVVVVEDTSSVQDLLGIDHLARDAVYVSSWEETKECVEADKRALALLPWRVVDFHVRALAIDGQRVGGDDLEGYPFRRHWWLVGASEDYPDLSQAIREELALEPEPLVSLVAVGDVMLGREVGQLIAANSPSYPFLLTHELTAQADVSFANLECPITSRGVPTGGIAFWAVPEVTEGLDFAGFDVLSLANNHSDDYGEVGLQDTLDRLEEEGIAYVGVGHDAEAAHAGAIVDVQGLRVAFLAYNHIEPRYRGDAEGVGGAVWLEPEVVYEDVNRADAEADLVVVSFHWGTEYSPLPDSFQREVARGAVEAGADLILGHHSHVVGAVSFLDDGFVAYSLGNFVFDQPFSVETMQGLMLHALMDAGGLKQVRLFPVEIESGQPRTLPWPEARSVLADVFQITESLDGLSGGSVVSTGGGRRGHHLQREWTIHLDKEVTALRACDLDGDRQPEIVTASGSILGPGLIHAIDADGSMRWRYEIPGRANDLACADLDGDGRAEVVATTGLLDAPGEVYVLDSAGQLRWRFGVEASVLDTALGDVDAGRQLELVIGEWGSFGDTIYVLGGDGSLWWKHQTDGSVEVVTIGDLDGDGRGEVIAGADDLYVLGSDGHLLWRYPTRGYVVDVAVGDLDNDDLKGVVAVTAYPDSCISAFTAYGSLSWRHQMEASPTILLTEDTDGDGGDEVLAGSLDGTVCLLDGEGRLLWQHRGEGPVSGLGLADVNADGVKEVAVAMGDHLSGGGVLVLDVGNGAVLGSYRGWDGVSALDVADMDGDGADEIVAATGGGEVILLRWTRE